MLIGYTMNSVTNINAPMVEAFAPYGVIDKPFTGGALYIMKSIGIYKIQSKIKPERLYIGSSTNIERRWSSHRYLLSVNRHCSIILQNHVNKYGFKDLEFTIILLCKKDELIKQEQYYVDLYDPYFNIIKNIGNNKFGFSEEVRKEMSERMKKRPPRIGYKMSEETKAKISASKKGKKASPETKRKLKLSYNGAKNMLGKHHTEEFKERMRQKSKGNKYGMANRGRKFTEEHRRKISLGQLGQIRITKKSVKVMNIRTGETYPSIATAWKASGLPKGWFYNRVGGNVKNNTDYIRI